MRVDESVLKAIKEHNRKHKHLPTRRKIKVTNRAVGKEKKALEEKLNKLKELKREKDLLGDGKFRLEQGRDKGNGQWEVQRNGESGNTNVAEVIAPDGFPNVLNNLPAQQSATAWAAYNRYMLDRLVESMNSGDVNGMIEVIYVTLSELMRHIFGM